MENLCKIHPESQLNFFCQTCDLPVCSQCLRSAPEASTPTSISPVDGGSSIANSTIELPDRGGQHSGHVYTSLAKAVEADKARLRRLADALRLRVAEAEGAVEQISQLDDQLQEQYSLAAEMIDKQFNALTDLLNRRRVELHQQLSSELESKKTLVQDSGKKIRDCMISASTSLQFLDEKSSNDAGDDDGGLSMHFLRKQLHNKTDAVFEAIPTSSMAELQDSLDVRFSDMKLHELQTALAEYGSIGEGSAGSAPSAENHRMTRQPIDAVVKSCASTVQAGSTDESTGEIICYTGIPHVLTLTTVDDIGVEAALTDDNAIIANLNKVGTEGGTGCIIQRVSASSFLLTFTIHREGGYSLSVLLFSKPISASPVVIRCNQAPPIVLPFGTSSNKLALPTRSASAQRRMVLATCQSPRISSNGRPDSRNSNNGSTSRTWNNNCSGTGTPRIIKRNNQRTSTSTTMERVQQPTSLAAAVLARRQQGGTGTATAIASPTTSGGGSRVAKQSAGSLKNENQNMDQLRNFCHRVILLTQNVGSESNNRLTVPPSTSGLNGGGDSEEGSLSAGSGTGSSNHQFASKQAATTASASYLFSFGKKGRGRGEFSNIQDVCAANDGRLIVTDSGNQCVQVFSSSGEFRLRFGTAGRNPGQLARPTGVCVADSLSIPGCGAEATLVADYDGRCVHVFNEDGQHVSRLGSGHLLGPKGVCVVPQSSLVVVVDNRASQIFMIDARSHKLVSKFGQRGAKLEQLAGPHFAAVVESRFCQPPGLTTGVVMTASTSQPLLAVTDFHNHAVKIFDLAGNLHQVIGQGIGEGPGQFNAATGLTVDSLESVIYASDWGNSRIQAFGPSGSFCGVIATPSSLPIFGPQGLAFDVTKRRLIVADSGNHLVKIFRTSGPEW